MKTLNDNVAHIATTLLSACMFLLVSLLQSALMKEAMTLLSSGSMSQGQASSRELRKRHATVQEKIQSLWNTTSLYDKAIGHFEGNLKHNLVILCVGL